MSNTRKSTRLSKKAQIFEEKRTTLNSRSSRQSRIIRETNLESDGESVVSEVSSRSLQYFNKTYDGKTSYSYFDSDEENTVGSSQDTSQLIKSNNLSECSPRKHRTLNKDIDKNGPSTPPKQRKLNTGTESSKEDDSITSPKTPSGMISRLSLNSPTNKSEEEQRCNNASRKSLFSGDVYQIAKRALHSTTPGLMPGRQRELGELEIFIEDHMKAKTSGSLYISGPPGTGKTATLTQILDKENINQNLKKVYVNCTSIKSSGAVFSRIIKELGVKGTARTEKEYLNIIEKHFLKTKKMNLLVLDEMDQLESKNQSVLYTIFEWPAKFKQNIILIGIANALDLTDRILPRLQARCELKPKLLHFAPYSKQQILEIITSRLEEVDALKVFSPPALQMLAGKVAAVSGDVRRALDIARRVIEIIEKDAKDDILQSIENIHQIKNDFKKVDLKEVIGVLNNVYGTTQNLSDDCDSGFPLQQKIVICSLLLLLKKSKNKDITVGKLHDIYKKVCTKRNLFSVDQAEFVSLCSLIETKGILRVSGKKEPRLHKVTLEWDQEEVMDAIKDKVLISSILQDDSFISRS